MRVLDRLTGGLPGVDAQVVGVRGEPLAEHGPDRVHQRDECGLLLRGEGEEVGLVASGHDEGVPGAHRETGREGDRQVVAGQQVSLLAPPAEDAPRGPAHAPPRAASAWHTRSHRGRIVASATEYRTVL